MDAKSLSKLFREAVSFDFKKEKITSYAQVRRNAEAFYTLLDRDAFLAMLDDYLFQDNQLMDIFVDLNDAGLGMQKLAEKAFQDSPRMLIAQFITQPKYAYHQNDVGKVYLAINTWLCFFGASEVKPEWSKCPLCGGAIKSSSTTQTCPSCKKATNDFISIMTELSMMLETERSGKTTPNPAYWDLIKTGTEFYTEYKLEIENRRSQRTFEQHEEDLQALNDALYEAEKIINSFYAKADLESGKEKPDFEALLRELIKNQFIAEATKLHNEEFAKKLSAIKKYIEEKKKVYLAKKAQDAQTQTFQSAVKSFIESFANLEQDLTAKALTMYRFKTLFDSVSRTYTKVMASISNGFEINEAETMRALERFDKDVRERAQKYLLTLEQGQKADEQQKKLLAKITEVLNAFNGVTGADNRSAEMTERFVKEIENADAFQAYRIAQPAKYNELVAPIRDRISELIQEEKKERLESLEEKIRGMVNTIQSCSEKGTQSEFYKRQLEAFKRDQYYADLKKHKIYVEGVKRITEAIESLKYREDVYQRKESARRAKEEAEKKAKTKKLISILALIAVIFVAIMVIVIVLATKRAFEGVDNHYTQPIMDKVKGTIQSHALPFITDLHL